MTNCCNHSCNQGRLPAGRLGDEVKMLDEDIQKWIYKSIPEGATIANFAVACLVDQYHEEKEN